MTLTGFTVAIYLTTLISRIHCLTVLCQYISEFSHPRPSAHVLMLLGLMEHVRHTYSNPLCS